MPLSDIPIHEGITGLFGRHLVALCMTVNQSSPTTGAVQSSDHVYAGTILGIGRWLFLLTAGHVLKRIDEGLSDGKAVLEYCSIADTFGTGRKTDLTFPFEYSAAARMYIDWEGLDFGVVALKQHYQNLLLANGILPIDEIQWKSIPASFDRYELMGLPQILVTDHLKEQGSLGLIPVVIRVQKFDGVPPGMKVTPQDRFYGQLPLDIPLTDISGMSGGPIFGIRDGPPMKYWAIALQSAWLPDSKAIAGCMMADIGSMISEWLERNDPTKKGAF